ncbi:hypothetical protein HRW18_21260 [Streptomyces lunaelactis]|uniref:hypothetical protein n=1 Tax=Streptomyces lunaelactis TaxID=1535768 RepID=UPI001584D3F3|nr:hypothetical protein [Streptomyces lunaelactis]NUK10465.1 hypothetical protein [Streptomyces lunaelactis]NUK52910.1 hypothetical protein [Streptomyces lunaelactis]NUK66469.1 hypothetical protein [Streptomyces lunaelactis]NUL12406.1 hypothetical protein [Streptomyces lunaelactis]NUL24275.1 hypothetical protein [Streptomyces lunaelactis]
MTAYVVYDSGALIAVERGSAKFRYLHRAWRAAGVTPVVPGPVVAQVWRGGARQYALAEFLKQCRVFVNYTENDYRRAGWMLGQADLPPKKRPDAVDALVIVTAVLHYTDTVVTSDPADLVAYAATLGRKLDAVAV